MFVDSVTINTSYLISHACMFLSNINQRQIYIPQLPTDGKCVFSILASVTVHWQMHKALSQKRHP